MIKRLVRQLFGGLGPAATPAAQAHNAMVISLVTAALMAHTALSTWLYFRWQQLAPRGVEVFLAYTAAALLSAWLSRKGRPRLGITLLLLVIMTAVFPYLEQVVPGQGLTVALLITIAVTAIAVAGLPPRGAALAVLLSLPVGAALILYDFYGTHRYVEPQYAMTLLIGGWVTAVYVFYLRGYVRAFGLRTRMVLAFMTVALVPLLVLSVMNTQRLSTLQNEEAARELTETATQLSKVMDNYLQTQMDVLRTEARIDDLRDFASDPTQNREEVQSLLRSLSLKDPVFITSYAILDHTGANLLDTNADNIGANEADRTYFHTPMVSGRPYVSGVLFYNSQPRLVVSSPLRGDTGEIIGLLRAEYNAVILQWLLRKNVRQDVNTLYAVLVEDENYLRLAHTLTPSTLYHSYQRLNQSQVQTLQKLGRLPNGTAEELSTFQPEVVEGLQRLAVAPIFTGTSIALSGEHTYSTGVRLTKAPWILMTRMSVASVREAVTAQTRSTVILALLSAALVALVGIVVTQVLTAPIVRLTQVAQRVAQGDLSARAVVHGGAVDEIGALSTTFNEMTSQLQDTLAGLEQRVAERTRALELSADISRRLSTILDPAQLVSEVVDLLQFAFGYYHVHIYLMADTPSAGDEPTLVMAGGTGEAGKTMLERRHTVPLGRGLVGQACATGDTILSPDTRQDANWLPNPLLPETRSELAVPILLGDEVLGALDVQHNTVRGLSQQDADLLRGIANQLAIALRNARQYVDTQRQAQQEALTVTIVNQIQQAQSMPEALQVAVRELGRALAAPQTAVRLHLSTILSPSSTPPSLQGGGRGVGEGQGPGEPLVGEGPDAPAGFAPDSHEAR